MHAEIIAIGAELLLGEISDTNSTFIARTLREIGVEIRWMSVVGDNAADITASMRQAYARSPIVITTGGLGPTVDDPTRAAIAAAFDRPLEFRPELWAQIEARFARFKRVPTPNNRKQAEVPAGALAFENPVGTAPCFAVEHEGGVAIALPGVPREMEHMLLHAFVPYLQNKFNLRSVIRAKVLRTAGIGESMIDEKIGDLESLINPIVGLAAHPAQTDIRITAKAATLAEAETMIAEVEAEVRRRLGEVIYGEGKETVEAVLAQLLAARAETVAVAEVGADGHLAARLRALGSSALCSVVLPEAETLTATALAESARAHAQATWGLGAVLRTEGDAIHLDLALASATGTDTWALGFGSHPGLAPRWLGTNAFNLLRLRLLKQR